jgi:hypothetical protein
VGILHVGDSHDYRVFFHRGVNVSESDPSSRLIRGCDYENDHDLGVLKHLPEGPRLLT